MKKEFPFKNLIQILQDRIPQRGKLAELLAEILGIEKEAVYRRLRGSVPFSFQEVHAIALYMGFSLDSIAENISPVIPQITVSTIKFIEQQEKDFTRIKDFTESICRLKDDLSSESGAIGSIFPTSLYISYENIHKFHIFKWSQQLEQPRKVKTFADVHITEYAKQLNQEFVDSVHLLPKSVYIFDRQFLEYFISDIRFFFEIRLITREDILLLKNDLHSLINDLERYTINGCFDTGNKLEVFLANVHLDTNYNYMDASTYKLTMMRSFAFSDAYSFDEGVFQNLKNWLVFLKRTSTLISEGNVAERIRFFEQQRKLIEAI